MKRSCLTPDEIRHTLAGNLSGDEFDDALAHLDDCENCRDKIDALQSGGSWIAQSLADEAVDPLQAETACQMALWRMLETPVANEPLLFDSIHIETLGPYRLTRTLGQGGMGTVHLAQHERLKRQVAIKLLPRERVDAPGWLDRFDREMTSVAAMEHPNVVRATDAGHEDGWHFLVMEYLSGLDVGQVADRMQRLPIADACEIVRQAALGLAHIHETGLIHRDIKPSNLMLCQSGVVKILDLGLVLPGDDPLSKDDRLTTVGHLMGTMPYMAPEQLADSRSVCPRADIYSLGATLFRLITGRTPHQKKGNLAAHILAITGTDAPKLSTFREDVDNELETLVSEMLSRDPNHRPDSAADIARRLEPAGNDSRLKPLLREALRRPHHSKNTASRLPSVAASQPPTRRHKWVAWAMGGFAATVLLAGFLLKLQTEKGELIVHSQQDDVTLLVKQDDQLVQRLTIESSQPGRTVLRKGTYRIEIDGGGTALQLSKDVVTIGAKQSNHLEVTKRPPNDASQATLFKGQSLDHWMSLLTREKEVDAVGQAMLAVEILTRDGHPQDRYAAAETTINLAKKHGGIAQESLDSLGSVEGRGPINNPDAFSRRFMAYFLTTIPRYFPSPGLQLIDRELRDGPQESRVASVMALNQYVAGARSGYGSSEAKRDAAESMRQFSSLPENKPLIESIGKQLLSFDSSVSNPFGPGGPAQDAAFMMMFGDGQSILGTPWAEERVQNALQRTAKRWDNTARNLRIQDNTGMGLRLIPTEYYLPSIELAKANSAEAQWDFLAEAILYDRNFRELTDDQQEQVFQSVANEASAQLLTVIENRLKELVAQSDTMEPSDTDGFGQIGFGMGRYQIPQLVVELSGQNSTWPRLLAYYANETPEPDRAIEMLEKVRWQMERHKADQIHKTGSVFNWVDDALATLQSRDKK